MIDDLNDEDNWNPEEDGWSSEEDWNGEENLDPNDSGAVLDYPSENSLDEDNPIPASASEMKEQEQEWKIATIQAQTQSKKYGNKAGGQAREIQELVTPKVDPKRAPSKNLWL